MSIYKILVNFCLLTSIVIIGCKKEDSIPDNQSNNQFGEATIGNKRFTYNSAKAEQNGNLSTISLFDTESKMSNFIILNGPLAVGEFSASSQNSFSSVSTARFLDNSILSFYGKNSKITITEKTDNTVSGEYRIILDVNNYYNNDSILTGNFKQINIVK